MGGMLLFMFVGDGGVGLSSDWGVNGTVISGLSGRRAVGTFLSGLSGERVSGTVLSSLR